ncbi:MAG: carboxylating nicotinate-nucleotide diphosphorylase [Aquificaceae bacterium]
MPISELYLKKSLENFILEDVNFGDLTCDTVLSGERIRAVIITKQKALLAGIDFAMEVFKLLGEVEVIKKLKDGQEVFENETILEIEGDAKAILTGERVALNLIQRLSGIATLTKKLVKALEGSGVKLLDTRKTTPGLRVFEKYAVRVGGGLNHRFGLFDAVMIKDNHKRAVGGVEIALKRAKERAGPFVKIIVEIENLEELELALKIGADVYTLDNFSPEDVKRAVEIKPEGAIYEVSGGINLENVLDYAIKGVDYISSGYITHSAKAIDMSLRVI